MNPFEELDKKSKNNQETVEDIKSLPIRDDHKALFLYNSAMKYFEKGIFEKAFQFASESANLGFIEANHLVGCLYYFGQGIKEDINKAIKYLEEAANKGIDKAQFLLGVIYENADKVPQDFKKAFYWYSKAARSPGLGHSDAQYRLGRLHLLGKITNESRQDNVFHGLTWLAASSLQKNEKALNLLNELKVSKPEIADAWLKKEEILRQFIAWYSKQVNPSGNSTIEAFERANQIK